MNTHRQNPEVRYVDAMSGGAISSGARLRRAQSNPLSGASCGFHSTGSASGIHAGCGGLARRSLAPRLSIFRSPSSGLRPLPSGLRPPASGIRPRGFTLVELMIAIGILSGVMVAIYASWASILRGSRVGMQAAADAQRTRMSMRVIEDALISMQMYQDNLSLYSFYADTSGEYGSLSVAAYLAKSFPGSGVFEDQPVRRVTFTVEPGPLRASQLVMRQTPLLAAREAGAEGYTTVLATDLNTFALEFWGQNSKEWEKEWLWTNQLPKLVRVTLAFGHTGRSAFSSRPKEVVIRTIAIPAMIVDRTLQMGAVPGQPGNPQNPGAPGVPQVPVQLPGDAGNLQRGGLPPFSNPPRGIGSNR